MALSFGEVYGLYMRRSLVYYQKLCKGDPPGKIKSA